VLPPANGIVAVGCQVSNLAEKAFNSWPLHMPFGNNLGFKRVTMTVMEKPPPQCSRHVFWAWDKPGENTEQMELSNW